MPRKIFPLKLSDAERAALDSQAAAAGLNPSAYLRLLIEKDAETMQKALTHLRERQGDWGKAAPLEKAKPLTEQEAADWAGFDFGPG